MRCPAYSFECIPRRRAYLSPVCYPPMQEGCLHTWGVRDRTCAVRCEVGMEDLCLAGLGETGSGRTGPGAHLQTCRPRRGMGYAYSISPALFYRSCASVSSQRIPLSSSSLPCRLFSERMELNYAWQRSLGYVILWLCHICMLICPPFPPSLHA